MKTLRSLFTALALGLFAALALSLAVPSAQAAAALLGEDRTLTVTGSGVTRNVTVNLTSGTASSNCA